MIFNGMTLPRSIFVYTCACAGALLPAASMPAEWILNPIGRVTSDYTYNPRLLRKDETSSAGVAGELQAWIERRTGRSKLWMQPRLRSARYHDDQSLDSDDQFLGLGYDFTTERSSWAASANLVRDTTLTSEIDTTGIVQSNRRHESVALSAGPTFALTQRLSAGARVNWQDNRYVDAVATGLVDYEYRSASLFVQLASSELSQWTLTANAGELIVPGQDENTRNAILRLGWRYRPTQLWTLDLSAGPAVVDAKYGNDHGAVFKMDLKRSAERWGFNTSIGRDLAPTGRGVLTRRDQVAVGVSRKLTEFVSGSVFIRALRNQDVLPSELEDIEYGSADLRVDWKISQNWGVAFAVAAGAQERESLPDSAHNYRASLSVVWNGQTQFP